MLRKFGKVGAATLALLIAAAPAAQAQAQTYRFWSYWTAEDGSWAYASSGPATHQPADGSVEGWRFTVSDGNSPGEQPRKAPSFDKVCAGTAPKSGTKRVAVVIDYGTANDAPTGTDPQPARTACAQVQAEATALQVLAAVAKHQVDSSGLVCAIDGYPPGACGGQGAKAQPSDSPSAAPQGGQSGGRLTALGPALGGVTIAVIAIAAVVVALRRRRSQ